MVPTSPSAPGMAVGGLSAPPPFEPTASVQRRTLLGRIGDPTPQVFYHEAHEAHEGRTDSICGLCQAAWAALSCPAADDDDSAPAAVIEPATLALMEPDEARASLARLSPTQRVAQAVAQAAWLADFGYAVTHTEILAAWATA